MTISVNNNITLNHLIQIKRTSVGVEFLQKLSAPGKMTLFIPLDVSMHPFKKIQPGALHRLVISGDEISKHDVRHRLNSSK